MCIGSSRSLSFEKKKKLYPLYLKTAGIFKTSPLQADLQAANETAGIPFLPLCSPVDEAKGNRPACRPLGLLFAALECFPEWS
jgi:hypothetical protein